MNKKINWINNFRNNIRQHKDHLVIWPLVQKLVKVDLLNQMIHKASSLVAHFFLNKCMLIYFSSEFTSYSEEGFQIDASSVALSADGIKCTWVSANQSVRSKHQLTNTLK